MNPTSSAIFPTASSFFTPFPKIHQISSIDELAQFAQCPNDCSYINISIHARFTEASIHKFIEALCSIRKPILSFDLSNSPLGDEVVIVILTILLESSDYTRLEHLNLSNTGLTNRSAHTICGFLNHLSKTKVQDAGLFSLDLTQNRFNNNEAVNLVKTCSACRVHNLSLANNLISDECVLAFQHFITCGEISGDLDLRGNVLSKEVIKKTRELLYRTGTQILA